MCTGSTYESSKRRLIRLSGPDLMSCRVCIVILECRPSLRCVSEFLSSPHLHLRAQPMAASLPLFISPDYPHLAD
ncbi:hypothetical protein MTO96_011347 [Rhipicephalus appendiculatus]